MIGVMIVAHGDLGDGLVNSVAHVLGLVPAQFERFHVAASDDPYDLLPKVRAAVAKLNDGDGVLIFTDIYGATPCNLACKLIDPGVVEVVAGVNLPMLIRAFTYRNKGLEVMVKKAVSGGCDGVVHVETGLAYATKGS
jgi:PTS system ascorbate-specific IIA component